MQLTVMKLMEFNAISMTHSLITGVFLNISHTLSQEWPFMKLKVMYK